MYVSMPVICVCVILCVYVGVFVRVCVCMYACMYVYVYVVVHVCMYVCMCACRHRKHTYTVACKGGSAVMGVATDPSIASGAAACAGNGVWEGMRACACVAISY